MGSDTARSSPSFLRQPFRAAGELVSLTAESAQRAFMAEDLLLVKHAGDPIVRHSQLGGVAGDMADRSLRSTLRGLGYQPSMRRR